MCFTSPSVMLTLQPEGNVNSYVDEKTNLFIIL